MKPKTRKKTIEGWIWPDTVLQYEPNLNHLIEIIGNPWNKSRTKAKITFEWEEEKPMTKETKLAIHESISHWIRLRDGKAEPPETIYVQSCPLCKLYFKRSKCRCDGCPVAKRGHPGCEGTPWGKVESLVDPYTEDKPDAVVTMQEWRRACNDQISFLRGLLPKR